MTKQDAADEAFSRGFDNGYYHPSYPSGYPAWRQVPHARGGAPYHKGGRCWHAFLRGRSEGAVCRAIDDLAREAKFGQSVASNGV